MRRFFLSLTFGALLLTAACSKTEQTNSNQTSSNTATTNSSANASPTTKIPPPNIVTAAPVEVTLTAGKEAVAEVKVNIADGYHINGNPASKYQIATTLEFEANDNITPGKAQYPPSMTKKFSFSPDPIAVYESQATIKIPLTAAADVAKGQHKLSGKLRVQPCDDQVCYQPRSIEAFMTINVK